MRNVSDNPLRADVTELGRLILGMRAAYARGENAMAYARQTAGVLGNSPVSTLIAYEIQAGIYIASAHKGSVLVWFIRCCVDFRCLAQHMESSL